MEHLEQNGHTRAGRRETVTVLVPAYNSERYLRQTLESIFAQTRQADEVLIVDDGSSDNTAEIVASYGGRVRYVRQENQGIAGARNTGIREARCSCIALFDHDDLMLPDKLEKQMALLEADSSKIFVYSTFRYLYSDGSTKDVPIFPARLLPKALRYRNPVLPSTTIVRRSALLEVGGFHSYFGIDDWDLWWRLMRRFGGDAFQETDEALTLYRWHEANTTSTSFLKMNASVLRMVDAGFLSDLPAWRQWLWRRRIHARVFYFSAVRLRELHSDEAWPFAVASFLQWPLPTRTLDAPRFNVLAHMLWQRLRNHGLASLLPRTDCRARLEQTLGAS